MYELTPRKEKKRTREKGRERERERERDKIFAGKGMKYDFICRWGVQLSSMGLAVQLSGPVYCPVSALVRYNE